VGLGEVGFALAAADRPPRPHTPLQGAHDARLESFRVPPLEFFEQRRPQQPRLRFQQGTTSSSQTPASGSVRVRQARSPCWEGNPVVFSIRRAERTLIPVFAAAISCVARFLSALYLLT